MQSILNSSYDRIAVFRALNIGDLLCAIPAVRALRARYPGADIRLIGLPSMAHLATRFRHYFSSFSSFPGFPGLPEQPFNLHAFNRFVEAEAGRRHDLVIQMHGRGDITNSLVSMLGAGKLAGFHDEGSFCPDSATFMRYPDDIPEVDRHLRLMEFLGIETQGRALEFPLCDSDWKALDSLQRKLSFGEQGYVCIHPGARDMRRWWDPAKFARIADALAEKGYRIVFTGVPAESEPVAAVTALMRHRFTNLVGQTSLGTLAALIARARLVVSNDTGISHIAAATCTPSVVVFTASDPARWAPLDRDLHHVVNSAADDVEGVMSAAEHALRYPERPSAADLTHAARS